MEMAHTAHAKIPRTTAEIKENLLKEIEAYELEHPDKTEPMQRLRAALSKY